MRKISLILLFSVLFSFLFSYKNYNLQLKKLADIFPCCEFEIFTLNNNFEEENLTKNNTIKCLCKNAEKVNKNLKNKTGEQIKINQKLSVDFVLKIFNAIVVDCDKYNNTFYCYTKGILNYYTIQNKKVNLQIFCTEDYTIIGTPLILGWA